MKFIVSLYFLVTEILKKISVLEPDLYPSCNFKVGTEKGDLCCNASDLPLKLACLDLSCHMYP